MQFLILLLGALLFTYYQFNTAPVFFNKAVSEKAYTGVYGDSLRIIEGKFNELSIQQQNISIQFLAADKKQDEKIKAYYKNEMQLVNAQTDSLREDYKAYLKKADPFIDTNDTNYIFLRFVVDTLPAGLVGLLIAVIFLAAWGSIAAALNSLASCTMIDFYCRFKTNYSHRIKDDPESLKKYNESKWFTFAWGVFCIIIAEFSTKMGSLIEAVNKYGSLFYGVILGIFLVAFYIKKIKGNAVFWSAIISEIIIILLFTLDETGVIGLGFLWLNLIGAASVIMFGYLLMALDRKKNSLI